MGAVSPRIANPEVTGVPRPVEFLFGWPHWLVLHQVGTVVMMLALVAAFAWAWRRHPAHPYLLMVLASTAIVWQDPIMNWAPYAVYNPQLWHWPEDWPLVRLSPTVEPFIVIGYSTFYFIGPFVAAHLDPAPSPGARVHRLVRLAPPARQPGAAALRGRVRDGRDARDLPGPHRAVHLLAGDSLGLASSPERTFQFPLIWESALVTTVMIPAGVLCHRDDTGRTQAEKLAQRFRWFPQRPALATFLMMFAILNVAYFMYGAGFAAIRASGLATAVACPYPFPEAKVYDPQGFYEREGAARPLLRGPLEHAG